MTATSPMSVLYGVQGTGEGHLNRARLLGNALAQRGAKVDFVFSGRSGNRYPTEGIFGNAAIHDGIPIDDQKGYMSRLSMIGQLKPFKSIGSIKALKADRYDLVISDLEPMTAWAARLVGVPIIGLGQHAALAQSPQFDDLKADARWFYNNYAPVERSIGTYWDSVNSNVLPPMVNTSRERVTSGQSFTLVRLRYSGLYVLINVLKQFPNEHFVVYSSAVSSETQQANISIYPLSREGLNHHFQHASRIVCEADFDLVSQALHLGIPVLAQPRREHAEQLAHASSLRQLGLASVTRKLNVLGLDQFICNGQRTVPMNYPDVAGELADLILAGKLTDNNAAETLESLSTLMWKRHRSDLASRPIAA